MKKQAVYSPWSGAKVAEVELADRAQVKAAVDAAAAASRPLSRSSRARRAELLNRVADRLESRRSVYAQMLIEEAGKPRDLADAEISRAAATFRIASSEARSFAGECLPMDAWKIGEPYHDARTVWMPRGPVLGITPFNFPLNLVAHKVAPAIAAGCPILIKASPQAPSPAHALSADVREAAKEVGEEESFGDAFQCVSAENDVIAVAVESEEIKTLSFTGSGAIGWALMAAAGKKRVCLELGGNAAVIIDRSANLDFAAERCAWGGYAYAGQSCISVQRVYVLESVFDPFMEKFFSAVRKLSAGDPGQSGVLVGPVIDGRAAERILDWVHAAVRGGAKLVCGGRRSEQNPLLLEPTILTGTKARDLVVNSEVFGPVVCVERVVSMRAAIDAVNASRFGLQAGVFTDSLAAVDSCTAEVEAGGIVINDVPTARVDQMPYGGIKDSGLGREGVRYAMEEFSEKKLIFSRRMQGSAGGTRPN